MDQLLIAKVVESVFPPGCRLTRAEEVPPEQRFHIILGPLGPRWIVPADAALGWPVLRRWQPYKFSSRLKWTAVCKLYRAGRLQHLPGITTIGVGSDFPLDWTAKGVAREVTPIIYIGTPSPYRKAVCFLAGRTGVHALAKFPLQPAAAERIGHEAKTLSRLAVEKPGLAPRLLHDDHEAGSAVQEVIDGDAVGRSFSAAHLRLLLNMRTSGETALRALVSRVPDLDCASEWYPLLHRALQFADDPTPLLRMWTHGDFAPWNLKRTAGGELCGVDWEDASSDGIPLQDLIHYFACQAYHFGSRPGSVWRVAQGRAVAQYANLLHLEPAVVCRLICFYLSRQLVTRAQERDEPYARFLAAELSEFLRRVEN